MPYFSSINILFIHIPKTGGTSIENYLYDKYNIKRTIDTLYSNMTITLNNHSLQHSTYLELYSKKEYLNINFETVKIISAVRNPYERIVSDLFFYKLITPDSTCEEVYKQICYFLESNEFEYDNHKMEQYKYLINSEEKIPTNIIIMKTENLNSDMISNGFDDFDLEINTTNKDKMNYMELLNDDSIQLINEYYKKDFEYFNYKIINEK